MLNRSRQSISVRPHNCVLEAMDKYIFNYDEWLSGHSNRKTMMEKLERSLVPFEIFEAIGMDNDHAPRQGEVRIGENTYCYDISYDYNCIGHDVYDAILGIVELNDRWNNLLTGYRNFKVVMDGKRMKTIYSDHENWFSEVIDMFEEDDYAGLYACRCAYVNTLLCRYMLLRLLEAYRTDLHLLRSIPTDEHGNVTVIATDTNRNEWLMYAFSKREARELAFQMDGCCRRLTVIYFFNQDFEHDGNTMGYDSGCSRIISARRFAQELVTDTLEQRLIERRMLTIVSLLYNDHLEWHEHRIIRIAENPPFYGKYMKEQKEKLKAERKAKNKTKKTRKTKKQEAQGMPWYEKIPRTLLEDALNVLSDEPRSHADIFHFLCAANMVNAYVNQCNRKRRFNERQMKRMFEAKRQIFNCLIRLTEEHNPNVRIGLTPLPAIIVGMNVEGKEFQISFRGMSEEVLESIDKAGAKHDMEFSGYYMQPIATALYQYSYLLRWKGINN